MTADAIKSMKTLSPDGAKFAAAAATAVSGELKPASAKATATKVTAAAVVAKADAKLWKRDKEWHCHKCRNVNSKMGTTCVGCDFDNLTIIACKLCNNKQPAIAEICLKCKRPLKFSV